jgi:1,4-alpha-glucan branching enzyme
MPGDRWQRFATLRAYLGFMFAHPGKKLLFMGCEFAQYNEWNHDTELDWGLLDEPAHAGVQRMVRDLNRLLRATPALYRRDFEPEGFEWIEPDDHIHSVFAFIRRGLADDPLLLVVSHFTPLVREGYRLGVPAPGIYRERLNTDSEHYGGSNVGMNFCEAVAEPVPAQGHDYSIVLRIPPLSTVFMELLP